MTLGCLQQFTSELRRREARFRALVQRGMDGIAITDASGQIRYNSPTAEAIIGFTPEELDGTNIFARVDPRDRGHAETIFAALIATPNATRTCTIRLRHADERWRAVEIHGTNLLTEPGIKGSVLNYRDITARVRAEELLAGQARLLE